MKKMIVRVVGNNLGGGARRYCYILNKQLEKLGRDTITFIPKPPFLDKLSDETLVDLRYKNTRNWLSVLCFILKNKKNIDYIHLHLRNVCIIFYQICCLLKIPYIITVHAPLQNKNSLKQSVFCFLYRRAILKANLVVFISNFVKNDVLTGLIIDDSKITDVVIYNGSEEAKVTKASSIDTVGLKICVVGELTERKGIRHYKYLFDKIESNLLALSDSFIGTVDFIFYGEGPLKQLIIDERNKERSRVKIKLHGYEQNISSIYTNNDIHMILSENEAFGRVITEAMAHSVPTIALSKGAFPEIIQHGIDGVLAEDLNDVALAVIDIFCNRDKLNMLSNNAISNFNLKFTEDIFSKETIRNIEKVIVR